MLVLSRKLNEEILIGEDISLKVVRITGGSVKLSFIAPRDVTIRRREVQDRMNQAKTLASVEGDQC